MSKSKQIHPARSPWTKNFPAVSLNWSKDPGLVFIKFCLEPDLELEQDFGETESLLRNANLFKHTGADLGFSPEGGGVRILTKKRKN